MTAAPPRPPNLVRNRRAEGRTPWWVTALLAMAPAVVARLLVGWGLFNFEQLVAAVLAALVLLVLARHPARAGAVLVAVVPFQLMVSSTLFAVGVPGGVTRMAALWKELVVLAIAVAAWRRSERAEGRLDGLDRVTLAFATLGTLYFLIPEILASEQGASFSFDARFQAWRFTVLPSVLLFACRRLRATDAEVRVLLRGVTALGVAISVVALVEIVLSDWWNQLLVDELGVNRYRSEVLGEGFHAVSFLDIRVYGLVAGREIIRIGGPVVSHLTFSFVLLIAFGVLVERALRRDGRLLVTIGMVGCGAALLFTQTRSTIVGACILFVLALRPAPGRPAVDRVRYALVALAAGAVALPLIVGAGLADRFTEGDAQSDPIHETRLDEGLETVVDHPLGLGLGMGAVAPGVPAPGAVTSENQLLDTSVQLGVLGGALFVAQLVLLVRALGRAGARDGPATRTAALAAQGILLGLVVPMWFLQPFALIEVSWLLFALSGFALGVPIADRTRPPLPSAVSR